MEETVKAAKRRYNSTQRAAQAAATRRAVLDAAREVFVRRGYIGSTVAEIAATAGVAVDTLYATVGSKPVLLRELVETAISGTDTAVPAEDRDYVKAIHKATSAEEKLEIYADRRRGHPAAAGAGVRGATRCGCDRQRMRAAMERNQ